MTGTTPTGTSSGTSSSKAWWLVGGAIGTTVVAGSVVLVALVWLLVAAGCDVEVSLGSEVCRTAAEAAEADDDETPIEGAELHRAAAAGDTAAVRALLDDGADPDLVVDDRRPLECAARNGHLATAAVLIEAGATVDDVTVRWSLAHDDVLALVLDSGGDPDLALFELTNRTAGLTAMFGFRPAQPSPEDAAASVRVALARGAAVDGDGQDGTPLLWAAAGDGNAPVVRALLEGGADPAATGSDPGPAEDLARQAASGDGGSTTRSTALPPGALPEAGDQAWSPLLAATAHADLPVVEALLEGGADPGGGKGDVLLPLHLAAARGELAMVEALLDAGADPRPALPPGTPTPAETATATGHPEIAARLDAP